MFSQRELAPAEDQGFVFGIVQASPNATLDQTKLFTDQIYDVYRSFPESGEHLPDHARRAAASAAWSTKPWSERTQDDAAAADGVDGAAVEDSRASASSRRRRRRCPAAATSRSTS